MTKCEKCFHKKVCIDSSNYKNAESCRHYKDNSLMKEVVYCKDCKLRNISGCFLYDADYFCPDDFYCGHGER